MKSQNQSTIDVIRSKHKYYKLSAEDRTENETWTKPQQVMHDSCQKKKGATWKKAEKEKRKKHEK